MKALPILGLIMLIGACSDPESQVKDMRGDDPHAIEEYVEDSSTDDASEDSNTDGQSTVETTNAKTSSSEWSYSVMMVSEDNWGYQLFQDGKMIINQTSIPSVQGINGFDSAEKADKTASFILNKLENGIFPPTVSKEELDSLDVLRD